MIRCIPYAVLEPKDYPHRTEHRIVKAAVKFGNDVYTGWRHDQVIIHIHALGKGYTTQEDQGFVDNLGCFHTRWSACVVAMNCRQLKSGEVHDVSSEELWDKDGNPRTPGKPYHPCS